MREDEHGTISRAVESVAQALPQIRERPILPDLTDAIVWVPGGEEVVLTRDLDYGVRIVPKAFQCNGTSVPRALWGYEPPFGRALPAAILHDWHYLHGDVTRMTADARFRMLLIACGVRRSKAYVMWAALRGFGWWPWWSHDSRRDATSGGEVE